MKKLLANLGALAMGLVSLAVTVGLLIGLEATLGFDLFSFMLWFVVPVGALATGLLVGLGYYFGAVKLHAKPTSVVTWAMIALAAVAQVALYYAHYWRATALDGGPVRSYVDFVHFTAWSLSHAHYGIAVYGTTHGSVEVGWWGYGIAAVQFLALIFGSWVVALVLAMKPYCDDCGRYAADITKTVVHFGGDMSVVDSLRKLPALSEEYFAAVKALTGEGSALELELMRCPDCRKGGRRRAPDVPRQRRQARVQRRHLPHELDRRGPLGRAAARGVGALSDILALTVSPVRERVQLARRRSSPFGRRASAAGRCARCSREGD